jgi:hydroxymethylglutaryl-CoA reductase
VLLLLLPLQHPATQALLLLVAVLLSVAAAVAAVMAAAPQDPLQVAGAQQQLHWQQQQQGLRCRALQLPLPMLHHVGVPLGHPPLLAAAAVAVHAAVGA